MINELIPRVFLVRDLAHKAHWKTSSYAQHVALGEFYDGVIPAIDAIVEAHQGMFDLVAPEPPEKVAEPKDFAAYLRGEAEWVESNREMICSGVNAIGNLVDALTGVYLKAAYKLENLS